METNFDLPQDCHFCGEPITERGRNRECLVLHSLDWNHENWTFGNKVSVHVSCHNRYHSSILSSNRSKETRIKMSKVKKEQWAHKTPEERLQWANKCTENIVGYNPTYGMKNHNYDHGRGDICKKCGKIHVNSRSWLGKHHSLETRMKISHSVSLTHYRNRSGRSLGAD